MWVHTTIPRGGGEEGSALPDLDILRGQILRNEFLSTLNYTRR